MSRTNLLKEHLIFSSRVALKKARTVDGGDGRNRNVNFFGGFDRQALGRSGTSPLPTEQGRFGPTQLLEGLGSEHLLLRNRNKKMPEISLPLLAAWANAAFLGVAGIINWFDGEKIRALYERWRIPARSYRIVGLLEITAAMFLAVPHLRAWGIVLGAAILFGSIVLLLSHRKYGYATIAIMMLAALGAAIFAIPTYDAALYASV